MHNIDNEHIISRRSMYYTIQEFNSLSNTFTPHTDNNHSSLNNINSVNDFGLIHINARSINNNFGKIDLLVNSLSTYKFPIIGITETWLHSRSPPLFNINGYSLIRTDRKNGRGGGVAFYLNDKLKFKIRNDISIRDTETLFIEILNKQNKNIIIGLIYRPPGNPLDPFFDDLDAYIHILSTENKHIYLMGDFNIDLLSATQTHGQRLKNLLYTYALHPHIDKPTRITNTSSTLIDNIFSNNFSNETTNGILYYDISDISVDTNLHDKQ